jgi:hypothetical protein
MRQEKGPSVAYFRSAEDVYDTLGRLMQDAAASGGVGPLLQQANASAQLTLYDPSATITLAWSENEEAIVVFGNTDLHPGLTLEMSADTAHEIFLGKLNFFEAAGDGRVSRKGSNTAFLAIWAAAEFALQARYVQVLAATGHDDLASI